MKNDNNPEIEYSEAFKEKDSSYWAKWYALLILSLIVKIAAFYYLTIHYS